MKKKIKKVKAKEISHDFVKLGVAPEHIKDFQRHIGGGFLMSDADIKKAYAEYTKALELNKEEHLEMVFMIPKRQGSLVDGGIVTVWSGVKEAFLDPVYMKNVMARAHESLVKTWEAKPYFTKPKPEEGTKKTEYGYWQGQRLEDYSPSELMEIVVQLGKLKKDIKFNDK